MPNKAFFLDRDGTLNVDHDYVHLKEEWDWIPGVPKTLKRLHDAGFKLIVVTNQSGISRGRFSLDQAKALHEWVNEQLFSEFGFRMDAFYIAPWHPYFHDGLAQELLNERKPGTVLFKQAAERFDIDFSQSYMAGDKSSDIKPALELGMKPFLVHSRFTDKKLIAWANRQKVAFHPSLVEAVNAEFGSDKF